MLVLRASLDLAGCVAKVLGNRLSTAAPRPAGGGGGGSAARSLLRPLLLCGLTRATDPCAAVAAAGQDALAALAAHGGFGGVRALLRAGADYVVDEVCARLRQPERCVWCGVVWCTMWASELLLVLSGQSQPQTAAPDSCGSAGCHTSNLSVSAATVRCRRRAPCQSWRVRLPCGSHPFSPCTPSQVPRRTEAARCSAARRRRRGARAAAHHGRALVRGFAGENTAALPPTHPGPLAVYAQLSGLHLPLSPQPCASMPAAGLAGRVGAVPAQRAAARAPVRAVAARGGARRGGGRGAGGAARAARAAGAGAARRAGACRVDAMGGPGLRPGLRARAGAGRRAGGARAWAAGQG